MGRIDGGLLATPTGKLGASGAGLPGRTGPGSLTKAPIPLSACAPRFLMTTKTKSGGRLPPSPAQVKRDRMARVDEQAQAQAQAQAHEGKLVDATPTSAGAAHPHLVTTGSVNQLLQTPHKPDTPTVLRAVQGKEGRSAVARFRYSGPVPDLGGRSWL